jgi:hypothetical protein
VGSTATTFKVMDQPLLQAVLYGALAIHFVFGAVLGLIARIATSSRGPIEKEAEAEKPDKSDASLASNVG